MSTLDPYAHMALADELDTAADFVGTTASHSESEIMRQFAVHLRARVERVREWTNRLDAKDARPGDDNWLRWQGALDVLRALAGPLADVPGEPGK